MSQETETKTSTKQLSLRVLLPDHELVTKFLAPYKTKQEGFAEFVKLTQKPTEEINEPAEPIKVEQFFEPEEYIIFCKQSDDSILQAIKRGLEIGRKAGLQNDEPVRPQTQTAADFIPADLVNKVNILHRSLRMKNKIPESTQAEYLEQLLTYSLKYFLKNEYEEIYNHGK